MNVAGLLRFALVALMLSGCAPPFPPAPAPERPETTVDATFGATWDAVIDHFAAANIPIVTIERASGIIATSRLSVARVDALEFADCGRPYEGVRRQPPPYVATSVVYNVLVRGDGQGSAVKVTASWDTNDPKAPFVCQTTGVWEAEVEEAVKRRAESSG